LAEQLHVFGSRPAAADRSPPGFQVNPPSAQSAGAQKGPEATELANSLLSSLTADQLEILRRQLAVSLFPANNLGSPQENFRFNPPPPTTTTTASTTTATTTVSTTKRPINFRLKSRERMIHRNRARARNPNRIRLTTTAKPRGKPALFDPFTGADNEVNNVNSNLKISQNFASHPPSVTSFSQEKLNAFANLLAVVTDEIETTTVKPAPVQASIGSISLGEGGLMSPGLDNKVETVTSNQVNQFEFFTPKSNFGGSRGSTTMLPAFDKNFKMNNFVLVSSTNAPRVLLSSSGVPPTAVPVTQTRLPPSTPPFFHEQRTEETVLPFQTTIMDFQPTQRTPIPREDQNIFTFQPTPTGKKLIFQPTTKTKEREFEFPKEAFETNEIEDFSPKFFVDAEMKENFAIVKVKNHNFVEKPNSKETRVRTEKPEIQTTTNSLRENLADQPGRRKLSKKKTGRRRKVKRIKGPRKLRSKSSQNLRKRLPLIRRKSTPSPSTAAVTTTRSTSTSTTTTTTTTTTTVATTTTTTATTTTTTTSTTSTTTTTTTTTTQRILNSGKIPESRVIMSDIPSFVPQSSDDRKREITEADFSLDEDASARVLELTNNIMELKAKLEQLKKELEI